MGAMARRAAAVRPDRDSSWAVGWAVVVVRRSASAEVRVEAYMFPMV